MAEPDSSPADAVSETQAQAETPEPRPRPPFSPRVGAKIRMGYRRGTVKQMRGGGARPYDVQIIWDGNKYPEWYLYSTLATNYEAGTLDFV